MTAIEVISIPLSVLASGIFLDLVLSEGQGMSSIISSMRSKKSQSTNPSSPDESKMDMIKKILDDLDELRDDLTYDNTDDDRKAIEDKIRDRERVLDKILDK
jgi:hypothetical protein